ncbi:hypothetical protein BX616_001032 [Lobosporangium transversale]|uniref:G-protein coupled receptors family 3 profile domain-containing protein n=1 Tax=Lobosporangium transversale TaxID=64571 RepID=A0A1Y2GZA5_9FUNG|nr:hypothetical protein BCR41DRAFT_317229 [Lobosporangium transversale]KAF9905372.1 hypothetical protein BX616_001032 [Lobosporangium transversale]ORZ27596.1 hypothetical protein BCR41DRAFT_317229 [Lobosporangium transversale]|eukprot:XP_021885299.1 hypothetical protein BCR41DRAFT_317229 [Lobosporangium transversale]
MYQPDAEETGSLFISLACISLMAMLFGRKTAGTKLSTINYARGLVVALYLISWAFSVIAALLIQTNNYNLLSCQLSILSCIALYALSKIVIYLFLMEKVYVVTAIGVTRSNFFLYKVNLVLMTPYVGVIFCMVWFRNATLEEGGRCYIGLRRAGALPLILYDIVMSTWLTYLFLRALMSSSSFLQGPSKGKLRNVARRTLIGSLIALALSSANIFTLVYYDGRERGLICLASCTVDVTLNAITVHWMTSRGKGGRPVTTNMDRGTTVFNDRQNRGFFGRFGGGKSGDRHTQQFGMGSDKQVAALDSHISITVESYVEEYHQLHYGDTDSQHFH